MNSVTQRQMFSMWNVNFLIYYYLPVQKYEKDLTKQHYRMK
jgi:hypothetical protein